MFTMKLLYVLLYATYATCFHIDADESSKNKIVNGIAAKIKDLSYQASLEYKERNICGASIISENWMALGAQCFNRKRFPDMKIHGILRFGTYLTENKGETRRIKNIITHEHFNERTLDNDIAATEVDKAITFNINQNPIKLAKSGPNVDDDILISGFGALEHFYTRYERFRLSDLLRSLTVKVLDNSECDGDNIFDKLPKNMFCVAPGASFGDAGGPGVVNGELSGIMSFGEEGPSPSVYMKVAEYYQWFLDKTKIPDY